MIRKNGGVTSRPHAPQNAPQRNPEAAALTVVAAALLISPASVLWAVPARGWWAPYLLWLLLIAIAAWLARRRRHDD